MSRKFAVIILVLLFTLQFSSAETPAPLSLDKSIFNAEETVTISINIPQAEYARYFLSIRSSRNDYNYLGEFNEVMFFFPTEGDNYTAALVEKSTRASFSSVSFEVLPKPMKEVAYDFTPNSGGDGSVQDAQPSAETPQGSSYGENILSLSKASYAPGERVKAQVNIPRSQYDSFKLYHSFGGQRQRYMGDLGLIDFLPGEEGNHELILTDSKEVVVELRGFAVSRNAEQQSGNEPQVVLKAMIPRQSSMSGLFKVKDPQGAVLELPASFEDEMGKPISQTQLDLDHRFTIDIDLRSKGLGMMRLFNVSSGGQSSNLLDIGIEAAPKEAFSKKGVFAVKSYAIDPTGLDFSSGLVTATAVGTELWKCKDWVYSMENCVGEWVKISDIIPGQEYTIVIDANDPGFTETSPSTGTPDAGNAINVLNADYVGGTYASTQANDNSFFAGGRNNPGGQQADPQGYLNLSYNISVANYSNSSKLLNYTFNISYCHSNDAAAPTLCVPLSAGTTYLGGNASIYNFRTNQYNNLGSIALQNGVEAMASWSLTTNVTDYVSTVGILNLRYGYSFNIATNGEDAAFAIDYAPITVNFDRTNPSINLTSPSESSGFVSRNYLMFNVSANDTNLRNITSYLYNSSALVNITIANRTGNNYSFLNYTGLPDDTYYFNASAYDRVNNVNWTTTVNVTIDRKNPQIQYHSSTDPSGSFQARRFVFINVSTADANLENLTIFLFDSNGALVNSSNTSQNALSANFSVPADGLYYFNSTAIDKAKNFNWTATRNVTIDISPPSIYFTAPTPASSNYTSNDSVILNVTAADQFLKNISISLFNSTGTLIRSANLTSNQLSTNLTLAVDALDDGLYFFNASSFDMAGNMNFTETRNFTIDTVKPQIDFATSMPLNDSAFNRTWIFVNITAYDLNEEAVTFYLWNSSGPILIQTEGAGTREFNFTSLDDDMKYWYQAVIMDKAGNQNFSEVEVITLDATSPSVDLATPPDGGFVNDFEVDFSFSVNDTNLRSCMLYGNFSGSFILNQTLSGLSSGSHAFLPVNISEGVYVWNVRCNDSVSHSSWAADNRSFMVDTTAPIVSNAQINRTSMPVTTYLCLNVSASDSRTGIAEVKAEVISPNMIATNFTLVDDGTGCDAQGTDGIYSVRYQSMFQGTYTWNEVYATDVAGNLASLDPMLSWTASSAGNLTVLMTAPIAPLRINESELSTNYSYVHNCSVSCDAGGLDCENVTLKVQYNPGAFVEVNATTGGLLNLAPNWSCGDLSAGGASCTHAFTVISGLASGGNAWPVRCYAFSSNIGSAASTPVTVAINDHPAPSFSLPDLSWIGAQVLLNASSSLDPDGNIVNYRFEYDNNTDFNSPTTICNGALPNCTWLTASQNQCENNSISCFIRLTISDNESLSNLTYKTIGVDTVPPITNLTQPELGSNFTSGLIYLNASVAEAESGVGTVFFEYRYNLESWFAACQDSSGPGYDCNFDMAALPDGFYEIRAFAEDNVANVGPANVTSFQLNRSNPTVSSFLPFNDSFDSDGDVTFVYRVGSFLPIQNCTLFVDGLPDQTNESVSRDVDQFFYKTGIPDTTKLDWYVNCTQAGGFYGVSETRNVTIRLNNGMYMNISAEPEYYQGDNANFTISVKDGNGAGLEEVALTTDLILGNTTSSWWNMSWRQRKPVLISTDYASNRSNVTVIVNVTGLSGNITSCNEIRIVGLSGVEAAMNLVDGDGSSYCRVAFKANVTGSASSEHRYFAYFNNSAAAAPSYPVFGNYTYSFNGSVIADSYTSSNAGTTNYGTAADLYVRDRTTIIQRSYYKYVFQKPAGVDRISTANACSFLYSNGATASISAYQVYLWSWSETGITHNNQPCGTTFNNATACNLTSESTQATNAAGWFCWNVSNMANRVIATGNLSLVLRSPETANTVADIFRSREYVTNASQQPYLTFLATGIQAPNITSVNTSSAQILALSNHTATDLEGIATVNFDTSNLVAANYSVVSRAARMGYVSAVSGVVRPLKADNDAPIISLLYPGPGAFLKLPNVTFVYNVSDQGSVRNCSLLIDYAVVNTTYNPPVDVNLTFNATLTEGSHNWSINCTDARNNANGTARRVINIDSTGPASTLINPPTDGIVDANQGGNLYKVNATVSDAGIGLISTVVFEYRRGAGVWVSICSDTAGPDYECFWDLQGLQNENDYEVRVRANDTLGNFGNFDIHTNITVRIQGVNVSDVTLDDSFAMPIDQLDLVAGGLTYVFCNFTAEDVDNYVNILGANATLYSSTSSSNDTDDERLHYTNSSCTQTSGLGTEATYSCGFMVSYFAVNGTWICNATARNSYSSASATDNSTMGQLFALNLSTAVIDYQEVEPNGTSPEVSVDIINLGNMPMNISVYAFGGEDEVEGANLSMICNLNNISLSFERFSLESTDFASKTQVSSIPSNIGVTVPPQKNDTTTSANTTYWQFMVPPLAHAFGQCNGSVVFMAGSP